MNTTYRLEVTARKNGTFDHQVVDSTGKVIATRNSRKHYVAATIARCSLRNELANAKAQLSWPLYGPAEADAKTTAARQARVDSYAAKLAAGEQLPAFALSFNSKATPLTGRQVGAFDFLGFATE